MPRYLTLSCALVVLGVLTGCTTTMINKDDGESYALERHFSHWDVRLNESLDDVYDATVEGLEDLEIEITNKRVDKVTGRVDGKLADGRDVRVRLSQRGEAATFMTIHIGAMSDRQATLTVFQSISDNL